MVDPADARDVPVPKLMCKQVWPSMGQVARDQKMSGMMAGTAGRDADMAGEK